MAISQLFDYAPACIISTRKLVRKFESCHGHKSCFKFNTRPGFLAWTLKNQFKNHYMKKTAVHLAVTYVLLVLVLVKWNENLSMYALLVLFAQFVALLARLIHETKYSTK